MKLMVLDGNSIVNRAFYGVRLLSTRDGLYTNAIYGFLNILQKLVDEEGPDALCVAFDLKAPAFRHLAYEGYKATRHGMPEELAMQMPVLKEVLGAMNIPRYELEGWEADDLLGTISRRCEAAGWDCTVVTGDKDSLQLITEHTSVKLVSTRMGQTTTREMTPETFREEYGFDPIHIIDLKSLMGDSSDNIPGVKGVGEKTAMDLLRRYHSVREIYERFDELELRPALRKKLDEGREMAKLSYDLATIRCDAPLAFAPEDALRRPVDRGALYQLFLKLEFTKMIEKYGLTPEEGETAGEETYTGTVTSEVVEDAARLDELLALWERQDVVAVLTLPDLAGVAVVSRPSEEEELASLLLPGRLGEADWRRALETLFSARVRKAGHQVKELMGDLLAHGLATDGFVFDTALAAYLLAPTDGSYSLEKLAMHYFHAELPDAKTFTSPDAFAPLGDTRQAEANFLWHAGLVRCLYDELRGRLEELDMLPLLETVELPLCPVLAEMERAGFLVDRKALAEFGEMLAENIQTHQAAIYRYAGHEFNINSTQQLGAVLFDELNLPAMKKTKRGYSTNAEVLEKLRPYHPIIGEILDYRQLTKLKSTYVDGLTKVIAADGRIHTSFQNTVTATGRLSSTEPNLQNIPVRTPLGAEMRKMFLAAPGNVLVDADYSQIELRLLAHIAGDEAMQEGFRTGADVHTATAAWVFGVPEEEVTRQMRSSAKAVNFGIVYGISAFSLAQDIGVTQRQAKEYMDRYFEKYSGIRDYEKNVVAEARERGYVSTLMGRRRWLPELKSSNFNTRSFGERVALNMPIQGTAADIIKLAMVRVQNRLKAEGLRGRLVLQVHDELIVECPAEEGKTVARLLEEEMEGVMTLSVPLVAEAKIGVRWADAH
ncbi:MAG TPA: DNA polymerase I [Candidatus Onthomonas avicola]|nr:DNA polymerase I [Candidatus Onthomonas avicola]